MGVEGGGLNTLVKDAVDQVEAASLAAKFRVMTERSGGEISPASWKAYYYDERGSGGQVRPKTVAGLARALGVSEQQIRIMLDRPSSYLRKELLRMFGQLPDADWEFRAVEAVRQVVADSRRARRSTARGPRRRSTGSS